MRIPNKLKIGGHDIKVIISKEWGSSDRDDGYFYSEKNEIKIKEVLPQSQKESVLIHEILHAINSNLNHDLLSSLAEQLYQVLKDNKMLK